MMTWVQFGGLAHEKITKSMRLLADQVLPKFLPVAQRRG
jgi:hypothetical protein